MFWPFFGSLCPLKVDQKFSHMYHRSQAPPPAFQSHNVTGAWERGCYINTMPCIHQYPPICTRCCSLVGINSSAVMQTGTLVYKSSMQSLCTLVIHRRWRQSSYREKLREARLKRIIILHSISGSVATLAGPVLCIHNHSQNPFTF